MFSSGLHHLQLLFPAAPDQWWVRPLSMFASMFPSASDINGITPGLEPPTMNHYESQEVFKPSRDIRILPLLPNRASHSSPRTNGCLLRLLLPRLRLLKHYPKFETTAGWRRNCPAFWNHSPPKKEQWTTKNNRSWRFGSVSNRIFLCKRLMLTCHLPFFGEDGFHMVSHVCFFLIHLNNGNQWHTCWISSTSRAVWTTSKKLEQWKMTIWPRFCSCGR